MNQVSINLNKNIPFKNIPAEQTQPEYSMSEIQIPAIYQTPPEGYTPKTFKEKVKSVDMMGIVYPWIAHPILTLGTAAGIAIGVDKFSEACGGEYNKSLVGKAAKFGDNIENSAFFKNKTVKDIIKTGKDGTAKVAKLFKNSDVINAIRKTPSQAEWAIVKDETLTMRQRMVHEFTNMAKTLKLTEDGFVPLNKLGLDDAEHKFLKTLFNDAQILEEQASNAIQLKRIGKFSDNEILNIVKSVGATDRVKDETFNLFGNGITKDYLKQLESKVIKADDTLIIENACKNAKNVRIGAGNLKWLGKVQPFERKITCSELYNRLHSMGSGAKTKTGRMMSKFLQKCHRGFTFGGGKMNALFFVAPFLVESIVATMKADKNEKIGTAAHGLIESVSWVFTFPLAVQIMHHLAGAQYAGMGETKVQAFRDKINTFNEKVKGNKYKTYKDYKDAKKLLKKELKELEKVKGQNLLTKTCRKIGKFVTLDLETIKSYRGGNAIENTLRKTPNFLKNVLGVPMRFGIWMAISMGVLDAALNKGTKIIFGNYHDRFKEEEREAAKKEQKKFLFEDLENRLYETQAKKMMTPEIPQENLANSLSNNNEKLSDTKQKSEAIPQQENKPSAVPEKTTDKIKTENIIPDNQVNNTANTATEKPSYTYIPDQNPNPELFTQKSNEIDNYTYIPSSENLFTKEIEKNLRKYIPSQTAGNFIKTFDNSGLEPALRRADRAEQRALATLAGKFDEI